MQERRKDLFTSVAGLLLLVGATSGSAWADDEARTLIDRIYRADLHQCEQRNDVCRQNCQGAIEEQCGELCDARQRRCERAADRKAARDRTAE